MVVALAWRIRRGTDGFVKDATASLFVGFYLLFMVGFVMLMLREDDRVTRIVAFIAITVCNDVGGYFAGVLFGKHPIAPQVSPKKSWEDWPGRWRCRWPWRSRSSSSDSMPRGGKVWSSG